MSSPETAARAAGEHAPTLTEGSVPRHLVRLATPMVWGILAMMAFNATDTWFVAQIGARELAAMSFTFPVVMILLSLGIGIMAGTSSVIARAIGARDGERVKRLATDAILLGITLSACLTALGLLTLEPLFRLLGADETLLPLVADYMSIWYAGYVFFLVPMVGVGAMRATGEMKLQSQLMVGAALLNLVLDPLLIFGWLGFPRLELQGAAIATVVARAVSMAAGAWILHYRLRLLHFAPPRPAGLWASWRRVLHVGGPAAGTNMIIPISTGIIVALVAEFGSAAVAGFGVATRVEGLSLVVFFAMSAVIGPFVGQNLGAGRHDRILEALRVSALFCIALGVVLAVVLGLGATLIARLFNDDPRVVEVASTYLRVVPVSYGAAGIVMVVNAAFNGLGRPLPAVAISLTRMLILYVPLAWAASRLVGVAGIFAAGSFANLALGAAAYAWGRRHCRCLAPGSRREGG